MNRIFLIRDCVVPGGFECRRFGKKRFCRRFSSAAAKIRILFLIYMSLFHDSMIVLAYVFLMNCRVVF